MSVSRLDCADWGRGRPNDDRIVQGYNPNSLTPFGARLEVSTAMATNEDQRTDPNSKREVVENQETDLELERDADSPVATGIDRPYDPTLIRVDPKVFSLRNILDMIDESDLDLAPDFQRLRVWKPWQKSRLIESILLRIPLPAFYFSSDISGRLQVVDGVQRLSTIYEFVRGGEDRRGGFALDDLEYLGDAVGGSTFRELENTTWAKRLHNTQIIANVIDPQTPPAVKFDIFKRINTGGTPLTAQEIRHCMSGPQSRHLLKALAESDEFRSATGGRLTGHIRMADRELVLRALTFIVQPNIDSAFEAGSLEGLLNRTSTLLDEAMGPADIERLDAKFRHAMTMARALFGRMAFRKWPAHTPYTYPLNRALFEVWGSCLSEISEDHLLTNKSRIVSSFRDLCATDDFFVSSISSATGDPKKLLYRFGKIRELLA